MKSPVPMWLVAAAGLLPSVELAAAQQGTERELTIVARDGVRLEATAFEGVPGGAGVLLLHMCTPQGRAPWAPLARELAAAGYHVLTFNYRGVGGSGGESFPGAMPLREAGRYWDERWLPDVSVALDSLKAFPGVDGSRVLLGGSSCGVYLALAQARLLEGSGIGGVLALAGPTGPENEAFVGKHAGLPILAAASEEDGPAPQWMRTLADLSSHPESAVLIYRNAGHGTDMFAREPALQPAIIDWIGRVMPAVHRH